MATKNYGINAVSPVASGGVAHIFDTTGAYSSGTLVSFRENGTQYAFFDTDGHLNVIDNIRLTLGTGADADIYYDGTNLVIDPDVVGSGVLNILGAVTTSGILSVDDTTQSTTTTTGSIHTDGGLGVVLDSFLGGFVNITTADPDPLRITRSGSGGNVVISLTNTDDTLYFGMDSAELFAINDALDLTSTPAFTVNIVSGNTTILGDLVVSGAGPHAIGGTTVNNIQFGILGSFTSGGASTVAKAVEIRTDLTAFNGDTNRHVLFEVGAAAGASITTQNNSETIGVVATTYISEPDIAIGNDTITVAATLYIASAPSEGETDAALYVAAGDVMQQSGTYHLGAFTNATKNANMTIGLTINQGAADNQIFALKSSDVATGVTSVAGANTETDDFFVIGKRSATLGGTQMISLCEDDAQTITFNLRAIGGTADTTKTTSGLGLFDIFVSEHNGSNALANITADGNVFSIRARIGGADIARFIIDEDGDVFSVAVTDVTGSGNAVTGTAFDMENDAELIRAFDLARSDPKTLIRSDHDEFLQYNEDDLVRLGILGDTIDNGGMWNTSQNMRLLNGAAWQNYTKVQDLQSELDEVKLEMKTMMKLLKPGDA